MNTSDSIAAGVRIYHARGRLGLQAALFIVGGILLLLMLLMIFLIELAARTSSPRGFMPGIIGGASVLGIALIARGVFLLKSLQRVVIDPQGVHLEGFISRSSVAWSRIARIERNKQSAGIWGKTHEVLVLLGEDDEKLASIPDTLENFPDLLAQINLRSSSARGAATYDVQADERRRMAKESRTVKAAAIGFGVFTILFAALFIVGINEGIHLRRYASEGERVDAQIVRRRMVKITPYVEYRFRDVNGKEQMREVMMEQEAWEALEGEKTTPVEYLRSDPSWNRLVAGEKESATFSGKFLLLTGGGTLVFGFICVMASLGFDLKTENGKTTLVRRGRVLKEFGQTRKAANTPWLQSASAPPPLMPGGGVLPPAPDFSHPVASAGTMPKPKGVLALGGLCLFFGVAGVLLAVIRAIVTAQESINLPDGRVIVMDVERWVKAWSIADGVLALLLIVVGIELLRLKRFGRVLGMVIASLQILSSIGALVMLVVTIAQTPETTGPESMNLTAAQTAAVIGQLIGMIFPAILLVILARRRTAEVLTPGA